MIPPPRPPPTLAPSPARTRTLNPSPTRTPSPKKGLIASEYFLISIKFSFDPRRNIFWIPIIFFPFTYIYIYIYGYTVYTFNISGVHTGFVLPTKQELHTSAQMHKMD